MEKFFEKRPGEQVRAQLRRFNIYGDYLTRMQSWVVGRCPFFAEPVLLIGYAALFFLICGAARRAIVGNLGVILPGSNRFANWWRAYVVILNFSGSLTDAIRRRNDEDVIEWEIEGEQYLQQLTKGGAGALLLTAHMGNYDIAARVFADRFNRRMHAVRAPERQRDAQEMRRRALEGGSPSENLMVRYNEADAMLGVELAKAIQDGEVVAIQGDRALFEIAAIEVPFDDAHRMRIPKGPLVLSAMTGCLVYPVFFVRSGYHRYRVIARPPFVCERKRGPDQERYLKIAGQRWMEALRPVIGNYWRQWYVFEKAFATMATARGKEDSRMPGVEKEMHASLLKRHKRPGATRSSTPFFVLADRLGGEFPRPGVDLQVAAGIPQQNGVETAAWATFVAGLTAAGMMRGLDAAGLEAWAVAAMAAPLTFAALHLVIIAVAAVAGLFGFGRRGRMWIWFAGYSVLAGWLANTPGWTRVAGGLWLIWMLVNVLAWMAGNLWKAPAEPASSSL